MEENVYDEYQQSMEDQMDLQEDETEAREDALDYPSVNPNDSLFTLFRRVLGIKDSSKVGNLGKTELGELPITVRECQRIALLAELFNHKKFAKFFYDLSQITLRTSASKNGWFTELFVTQKKYTTRTKAQLRALSGGKKKWFGRKEQSPQTPEV